MLGRRLAYSFLLLLVSVSLFAQKSERRDSLVRLLGCDELQQIEEHGFNFRKALGHARFEHNSTLLVCDTALWNVNQNVINAFGNVKIIQNNTVLSSDRLDYLIDLDLAEFRGTLVQLQDKDKNTLRTRDLDYNTKDSVAVFRRGGALRDKDGQIIESDNGYYYSKTNTFDFMGNVNMYTDSIFVKTDNLSYNTATNIAVFGTGTNAWKDNNMLSSKAGEYDRGAEKFTFTKDVHLLTTDQEAWADTLVFYRIPNNVEMFGNVELLDTTRNVAAVAGYIQYIDSLSFIRMTRDPAVIAISEQGERKDTVYIGADTLILRAVPKCDVSPGEIAASTERLKEINVDPVTEYRRKAAEAAKAAAEEARKKREQEDPNAAGAVDRGRGGAKKSASEEAADESQAGSQAGNPPVAAGNSGRRKPVLPAPWDEDSGPEMPLWIFSSARQDTIRPLQTSAAPDTALSKRSAAPRSVSPDSLSLTSPSDSLLASSDSLTVPSDSLMTSPDSLAVTDSLSLAPKDSTKINFIYGIKNVKVFRNDMQVSCDSLAYNDLDSLIRLYRTPVVWNEIRRQYSADSITVIVKNQSIDRASLMSNAFIIVQEDSSSFDQIRGAEMMAYFDSTGTLRRFDAMGGSSGVFFIEEQGTLATVNKFESKMLTATLKNGNIQDLNYFDAVKSDAYPVVQMKKDEKILKGFEWKPDERPKGPEDVTSYVPRKSERERYSSVPRSKFAQTDIYFPGYMSSVYKMLASQDSLKRVRNAERKRLEEERKVEEARVADSLRLAAAADSLALRDSLGTSLSDSLATRDSLALASADSLAQRDTLALSDSLSVGGNLALRDTLGVAGDSVSVEPALPDADALRKAEKERRKAEREKARQDRIAAKEARWAELDARDAAKAKAKEEKALEKKRKNTLKTLKAMEKRRAKEERMLERYRQRFEKQKARQDARKARKSPAAEPNPVAEPVEAPANRFPDQI